MGQTIEDKLYQEYLADKLDLIFDVKKKNKPKAFCREGDVYRLNKYYLADKHDEKISEDYFSTIEDIGDGKFYVEVEEVIGYDEDTHMNDIIETKRNIIDSDGNLLFDNWDVFIKYVISSDSYVVDNSRNEYPVNIINSNKEYLFDVGFDDISTPESFGKYSFFIVRRGNKYTCIDTKGNFLWDKWYSAEQYEIPYDRNFFYFKENDKWYIVDKTGKQITEDRFDEMPDLYNGYFLVVKDCKMNYLNLDGKYVYRHWSKNKPIKPLGRYAKKPNEDNPLEYSYRKNAFGYKCYNMEDSFQVRYEPIKIYGLRYVLCKNNDGIILYDRQRNTNTFLGTFKNVKYEDNFIYLKTEKGEVALFIHDDKIIDITTYLKTKGDGELAKATRKEVIPENYEIYTENEFAALRTSEQEELIRKEKEENRKKVEIEESRRNLMLQKKTQEITKNELEQETTKIHSEIFKLLNKLKELNKLTKGSKISIDDFIITGTDSNHINPVYIETEMLPVIDMTFVNFSNTDISGVDFRGCNPSIFPQTIYRKDMRNCNMEGIFISPLMDFTGVDIRGARFSDDNDYLTEDGKNVTFKNAIYDETTTYNGIPFTQLYGPCISPDVNITMKK